MPSITQPNDEVSSGDGRGRAVLRQLFDSLRSADLRYCVLRNHQGLPDPPPGDVDVLVHPDDIGRFELTVKDAMRGVGYLVTRRSGRARLQLVYSVGWLVAVQLDLQTDFRHHAHVYGTAEGVLARATYNQRGIAVPHPVDEAVHALVHSLLTRHHVRERYRPAAVRTVDEERGAFEQTLGELMACQRAGSRIAAAVAAGRWEDVAAERGPFVWRLRLRHPAEPMRELWHRVGQRAGRTRDRFGRYGRFVVLMGTHGAGKTTTARELASLVAATRRRCDYRHVNSRPGTIFHLGKALPGAARQEGGGAASAPPKVATGAGTEQGRPRFTAWMNSLRAVYHALDHVVFYWVEVTPATGHGHVFVCDRYFYDYLVEPRGVVGAPRWLLSGLAALVPRPDLLVWLDADSHVIHARKPELTVHELDAQRVGFGELAARFRAVRLRTDEPNSSAAERIAAHLFPLD